MRSDDEFRRFHLRASTPSHVAVRPLDDELVLLNLDTEIYFGLDEVGARMWETLSASSSVEEAYQQLLEEYEVDAETLRSDLVALLDKLLDAGLIEFTDAGSTG